jgi:hypothetical protein
MKLQRLNVVDYVISSSEYSGSKLYATKNKRIIVWQIENSQVVETFKFWTNYGEKYVIFIELCMKQDPLSVLKGSNSFKMYNYKSDGHCNTLSRYTHTVYGHSNTVDGYSNIVQGHSFNTSDGHSFQYIRWTFNYNGWTFQ